MNSNQYRSHIAKITNVSRRGFLKGVGAGAFVLAIGLPSRAQAEDAKYAGEGMAHGLRDNPKLFVAIGEDGTVTVTNIRAEMGQGIRTGITMVIADELEADWAKMKVVQAVGNEEKYGNQDTDGSRSTRHHFRVWRHVGASARTMLEQAAAAQWKVPVTEVYAQNHEVIHRPTNRKVGYGALAAAAAMLPVPDKNSVKLKDPSKFRYIGSDKITGIDMKDITMGKATYGQDARMDGMLYAVVERPPVYGGKVASYDATETMNVPGVVKVVAIESLPIPAAFQPKGGVAVIAKNTWAANQGREKLKITWNDGPNASHSSDTYKAYLEGAVKEPGKVVRDNGNAEAALSSAAKKVTAEYYIPLLAHVPMEPPAALAKVANGKAENPPRHPFRLTPARSPA